METFLKDITSELKKIDNKGILNSVVIDLIYNAIKPFRITIIIFILIIILLIVTQLIILWNTFKLNQNLHLLFQL